MIFRVIKTDHLACFFRLPNERLVWERILALFRSQLEHILITRTFHYNRPALLSFQYTTMKLTTEAIIDEMTDTELFIVFLDFTLIVALGAEILFHAIIPFFDTFMVIIRRRQRNPGHRIRIVLNRGRLFSWILCTLADLGFLILCLILWVQKLQAMMQRFRGSEEVLASFVVTQRGADEFKAGAFSVDGPRLGLV